MKHTACALITSAGLAAAATAQVTRYVAPCGEDSWSGLSAACAAPDGPKHSIQSAINASVSGDTVLIAPGTYFELLDFDGRNITVQGAGIDRTIVDAQYRNTVVMFTHGETAAAVLRDVTIQHGGYGDPYVYDGGGVFIQSSSPTITNCWMKNNADNPERPSGAGIRAFNSSSLILNCRITDNAGDNAGGVGASGSVRLVNCFIARNNGVSTAVRTTGPVSIVNCTITNNTGNLNCGLWDMDALATVTNTVLWGNLSNSLHPEVVPTTTAVHYSDLDWGAVGPTNISADPLFLADFRISFNSPCIDAGDSSIFATYGDVLGEPRAVTLTAASLGNATGPRIDIGCFEVQPCPANCDGSTTPPILNVQDFICFQTKFAQGCP